MLFAVDGIKASVERWCATGIDEWVEVDGDWEPRHTAPTDPQFLLVVAKSMHDQFRLESRPGARFEWPTERSWQTLGSPRAQSALTIA